MGNFIGTYNLSIDAKNRMVIPAKVRTTFANETTVYLSLGFDGNIDMRLEKDHSDFIQKITPNNLGSMQSRKLMRMVLANTYKVDIDGSSRILLPQNLLDQVKITKDVCIIGMNDKYEIWSKEVYDKWLDNEDQTLSEIVEGVLNGI